MKTFTINGKDVAFEECTFTSIWNGKSHYGVLVHEMDDTYHDGDMIYGNGCEMPATAEDAEAILINETGCSDSELLKTVKFLS